MKKNVPESTIAPGHPDFPLLKEIADEIVSRAQGQDRLHQEIPTLLRECIDDVIQTARTGRRSYDDLEKTEKTYIGTRVEIMLRAFLELPKGTLDTVIKGHDVDIKHTMGSNWMIPNEALNHPCIVVAADEKQAVCYLGIIIARPEYLNSGANRDAKKTISAKSFQHILWLLKGIAYPSNFWRLVPADAVERIFSGRSGNDRVIALFREVQDIRISRDVIEAVAQQKDPMRRIRSDDGKGTRDKLAKEGLLLMEGKYNRELIRALGLPDCEGSEFISHRIANDQERDIARQSGFAV